MHAQNNKQPGEMLHKLSSYKPVEIVYLIYVLLSSAGDYWYDEDPASGVELPHII